MDDSQDGVEVTEELVLELGNQILSVLGSEDPINDLEPFKNDALYIELFKILFPQFPLDELQPGETFEEMADNLRALRQLLGEQVLETDLSYISATAILNGDLNHLAQFLQILMQVIALLAEGEGEGDEDEESQRKSKEKSKEDKKNSSSPEVKSSSHKRKGRLELSSPEDDEEDKEEKELEEKLMKQINQPSRSKDDPIIKDEPMHAIDNDSFDMDHEESPQFEPNKPMKEAKDDKLVGSNKAKVDVLHDPLLPDDDSIKHSAKKRPRAGSFSKNKQDPQTMEEDEAIAFDDLNPEDKLTVLQQLYEEYMKDPESFPEDQRILLEEELKDMIDKGLIEGFDNDSDESEVDERMKVKGKINFPSEPLPIKSDDDDKYEISKGEHELDVEEINTKNKSEKKGHKSDSGSSGKKQEKPVENVKEEKKEIQSYEHENMYDDQHNEYHEDHQEDEPDNEAEIIKNPPIRNEGTETPEIDDHAKYELLQKMQQEQEAISRRITRRK